MSDEPFFFPNNVSTVFMILGKMLVIFLSGMSLKIVFITAKLKFGQTNITQKGHVPAHDSMKLDTLFSSRPGVPFINYETIAI